MTGEWYHGCNRGTDKRTVFEEPEQYKRCIALLYASNGTCPVDLTSRPSHISDLTTLFLEDSINRGEPLVEIGAYSLMPTHPHLVLKQIRDNGIARFMQKVFTGYTMFFNLKHNRAGALFAGTYKAKHVLDDRYLKQLVPYVLLNPVELFSNRWKAGVGTVDEIEAQLLAYPYSSLPDFFGTLRPENKLLGDSLAKLYDSRPTLNEMLQNALAYYREHFPEV